MGQKEPQRNVNFNKERISNNDSSCNHMFISMLLVLLQHCCVSLLYIILASIFILHIFIPLQRKITFWK